jgi:hypothetical protein
MHCRPSPAKSRDLSSVSVGICYQNSIKRQCFASIRTYNTRLSTRTANRTHARKRAVSGLVIQITITFSFYAYLDYNLYNHLE